MNKWADYLISAVRYADQQQGYITYVKVHEDQTRKIGKGYTWNRDEIIEALTAGKSLMTIYKKETGDWIKGLVVNLIKKNGAVFISDTEESSTDHLSGVQKL
ncbi:MAG TPA: hypothetical protein PKA80_10880 [Ignavibacteriaceae bacterium]|nr:hypothetical protein [Ignavibacteriaceae bacterium]